MPTERFYNLPDEKRIRIIKAAYDELCIVSYEDLSINKIIQRADIPRGSFYQYFDNKDDLLFFMFEDFQNLLFDTITETLKEKDGDIFKAFFGVIDKLVDIGQKKYNCTLLKNVSYGIKTIHMRNIQVFQQRGEEYALELYNIADVTKLKISDEKDFHDIVSLLAILLWNTLVEIFIDFSNKNEIVNKAEKRINMIKYGVLKEEINQNV